MDKVSVLMTVYNAEKMLHESIPPVLSQTYTNIEIVIVNDGSTDKSADIIDAYKRMDKRIEFINRKENKGRVYSLNEALSYCTGKYIAINDADDISKKSRIEEMISFAYKEKIEESFGVIGSRYILDDRVVDKKEEIVIKTGRLDKRVARMRIFFGMPFIHSSFIYSKKALLDVGGFASEVTSSIDYFTLLKISEKYPIYAYQNVTVTRVENGNNFFMQPAITLQNQYNKQIIDGWKREHYKNYLLLYILKSMKDKIIKH